VFFESITGRKKNAKNENKDTGPEKETEYSDACVAVFVESIKGEKHANRENKYKCSACVHMQLWGFVLSHVFL